jgi:orotidine-5'-phosphate decarboxylase
MSNPIILSLDSDVQESDKLLSKIRPHLGMIKFSVGMWSAYGKECLSLAHNYSIPVFLDLKLHDLPSLVSSATSKICELFTSLKGRHFLSVHCFGGKAMCVDAKKAAEGSNVEIVGVSVLSSIDENDFHKIGFRDCRPGIRTVDLIHLARDTFPDNPLTHFTCSPNQISLVKKYWNDAVLITPGIRYENELDDDHKRTKSISFALKNGADWVVIGRPITKAYNPEIAAESFKQEAEKYR